MSTGKPKAQAERTEPSPEELEQITEREANQAAGGCGREIPPVPQSPSTSSQGPERPAAI